MPNFKTDSIVMPNFPIKFGNSMFLYKASNNKGESLIKVSQNSEEFFIQIKTKDDGFLVKADKISSPSQVVFVQQALRDFRDLCQCSISFSNIEPQKIQNKKRYRVLKDIEFFINKFIAKKEVWIEIGFGSGRHLLHQAKRHPDIEFIGLEIHKPSLVQVAKQCDIQELQNVYLLDYDARIFLEFLKSNSVGRIFVHFPVPWDKKPHRRVISGEFINECTRVLKIDGTLELRTDSQKYFDYSMEEFLKLNTLELNLSKNRDLDISSKYEDRWKKQEKNIYDISLKNTEKSPAKEIIKKISFDEFFKFEDVFDNFQTTVKNRRDHFLHVEGIYKIDKNRGVVKISFGASAKNERVFVEFLENKISYFPDNILATRANQEAHNLLTAWLKERVK